MITKFNLFEKLSEKELNRILDKMLDQGKDSLTPEEQLKLKHNSDNVKLPKNELIKKIKNIVEENDLYISMNQLNIKSEPILKEVGQYIHKINGLLTEYVEVIIYGGDDYRKMIDEYDEVYENLPLYVLERIDKILNNAIKHNYIEK